MDTKNIALPFKRSSHRQIVDADGNLIVQVFSGGCGIDAADAIEELIVRACNRDQVFDELVTLLRAADNKLQAMHMYHSGPAAQSIHALREKISAGLAKAGAA